MDDDRNEMESSILEGLNEFLQNAVWPETRQDRFDWYSAVQYLKQHSKFVLAAGNAPVFGEFFMKILESHPMEDSTVFSAIIDIITVIFLENYDRETQEMRRFGYQYLYLCRSQRHNLAVSVDHYMNRKLKVRAFPAIECVPVVHALRTGNHRLMQVLATNGYDVRISEYSSFAGKVARKMIRNIMSILNYKESIRSGTSIVSWTFHRSALNEFLKMAREDPSAGVEPKLLNAQPYLNPYDLVYLGEDPLWRPTCVSFQRLFVITLGMYALWLKLTNNPELTHFLQCLDIYFKTISEPYLAVSELRSLLIKYITHKNKEHLLDEWCRVFTDTMPFCAPNYEPRRLCHLVRCQVRENLCKKGSTLPAVLDEMEMPQSIKEFLLCKPSEENA